MGIRWLLKENPPGKVVSSLVIYMKSAREVEKLRMGRRFSIPQAMTGIV